jgi:predicted nuclease of predicted toxin-antitoxin system
MNNSRELKFLIDVGVGGGIEKYLRAEGYDTKAVREIDPQLEDQEIIRMAVAENRMVVTMDKDFGELVYHCSMKHRGVLLLKLEEATGQEKLEVFQQIMEKYSFQIVNCFCVFQNDKLRIRKQLLE